MGVGSIQQRGHPYAPIYLYTSVPLYIFMFSYTICSSMSWGLGGHLYTPCVLVSFQGAHLSGISVSVSTSICLSAHNSHTSCSSSLWVASLLDWMPMDVCYASFHCSFLCSAFIMSQVSTTMAMITTSLVTCVLWHIIFPQWLPWPLLDRASSNIRST